MDCPYCNKKMKVGKIVGDGRTKVRWEFDDKKMGFVEKAFTDAGLIKAKYSLTKFYIEAYYCETCGKIIIEQVIK